MTKTSPSLARSLASTAALRLPPSVQLEPGWSWSWCRDTLPHGRSNLKFPSVFAHSNQYKLTRVVKWYRYLGTYVHGVVVKKKKKTINKWEPNSVQGELMSEKKSFIPIQSWWFWHCDWILLKPTCKAIDSALHNIAYILWMCHDLEMLGTNDPTRKCTFIVEWCVYTTYVCVTWTWAWSVN